MPVPFATIVGVVCEILATIVGTAGKQMVSCSGREDDRKKAKLWKTAGVITTTLPGPVLDSLAYALAPQAIIAPLNGLDIVWNTCSAPITLGEKLRKRHVFGTVLIFAGASLSAAFGPKEKNDVTLEYLEDIFLSWGFASYLCVFVGLLLVAAAVLIGRPKGVGDKTRGILLGLMAGGIAGNMYFVACALGLLGSSLSTGDWSAWTNFLPYLVVVGALACAIGNIPLMAKGLEEYEALFMVTLFEGCHIAVACISAEVVMHQLEELEPWESGMYTFSVCIIIVGLLVIQTASSGIARTPEVQIALDDDVSVDAEPSIVVWAGPASGLGGTLEMYDEDGNMKDEYSGTSEESE